MTFSSFDQWSEQKDLLTLEFFNDQFDDLFITQTNHFLAGDKGDSF